MQRLTFFIAWVLGLIFFPVVKRRRRVEEENTPPTRMVWVGGSVGVVRGACCCCCADKCPLGKIGSQVRCTTVELVEAGWPVIHLAPPYPRRS